MNHGMKRFLCVLLCAALLLGSIGTATAAGKKKAYDPEFELFDTWYYVYDTIPENMRSQKSFYSSALWDANYMNQENITNCEVNFLSGDEALKDAVVIETQERGDGGNGYTIRIDNEKLTVPGKADFQVVLESQNFRWEQKGSLVVLDYNEYPLVEEKNPNLVYEAQLGDSFVDNQVMADAAEIKAKDIAKAIGFKTKLVDIIQHSLSLGYSYEDYQDVEDSYQAARKAVDVDYGSREVGKTESVATMTVKKYGNHHLNVSYELGNVRYTVPFTVFVEGFAIETFDKAVPGGTLQFRAYGSAEETKATWSVEGEGATIDEKGVLKIADNVPMGTCFVVKAVSADGKEASAEIILNDGALADVEYPTTRDHQGFQVPIPGGNWYNEDFDLWYGGGFVLSARDYGGSGRFMDGKVFLLAENESLLLEDPEKAKAYLAENMEEKEDNDIKDVKQEYIEIDGHPALISTLTYYSQGSFYAHMGMLWYPRNTRILRVRVYSQGETAENTTKVSIEDMKQFASFLKYDPATAPFTAEDAALTLSVKDDPKAVSAGKTLQFKAEFKNPSKVSNKFKNNGINWTALNAETGEEVEGVSISAKGQLKVDKNLAAPVDIQVKATSATYENFASYNLKAIPVAGQIAVEPAELFFYVGKEDPQTVKATITPDTVPLVGITWTPAKKDIVEITDNGDGTVVIKPLKAGKTTIAVKEPGGKNAKLNVSVVDPVESVELSVKGNAKAGGTVTVSAALQPKTAGNKNLEWTLDVGEDIATIDAKGKVKISKEAASGTKITVTCKALGAPEPIVATAVIEIP